MFCAGMVGDQPKSGVLTSVNYPGQYANYLESRKIIQVAEGKAIRFAWTNFNTESGYDYVKIMDADGTLLTPDEISGSNLPPPGTSGHRWEGYP